MEKNESEFVKSWYPKMDLGNKTDRCIALKLYTEINSGKKRLMLDVLSNTFGDRSLGLRGTQWNYLLKQPDSDRLEIELKTSKIDEAKYSAFIRVLGTSEWI